MRNMDNAAEHFLSFKWKSKFGVIIFTNHFDFKKKLNEEHFTFHLQYKYPDTFANRKYEQLSYPKNPKMCDPTLVTLLIIVNLVVKMRPHLAAHPH